MISRNSVGSILFICGLLLSVSNPASAEERVLGSWTANGKLFAVGDKNMVFHGEAHGVVHHNDGKGKLDTAKLYCSLAMHVDETNNQEKGNGFCAITTTKGDKIYADFKCSGPLKKCKGKFNHLGGTGEFKGISGGTDLRWKAHVIYPPKIDSEADFAEQQVSGYFVLPNLTYSLP